ncbi:30S ribosomal protein S6 alpha, chloroplastic [Impatiens glandulifera]|uniref:30S ribosomal protein S6 alpha, chloroplastic n=1 Tax=Impatiens glandulifera TaxID=253017 RepID=UPI001FB13A90|nr:30S ribosomal protein S6 alpha, chloroplastic [Impatiens glandulifera]
MAASSMASILPISSSSSSFPLSTRTFVVLPTKPLSLTHHRKPNLNISINAQTLDFAGTFFERGGFGGGGDDDDPPIAQGSAISAVEEEEPKLCPPGYRQYETMAVLRPDMSEDERLNLTQKYEELLVAGGGMYVEVFNRGVIPLAYGIKKKNKAGETNTYLDGIYLLFSYYTKPEAIEPLESVLKPDDDIIRSSSFKIRKRKY